MPTPFMHLASAIRAHRDPLLPQAARALIDANPSAFWLGSVAADAQGIEGLQRVDTHFYAYDRPMERAPWRVMLDRYPTLIGTSRADLRVFTAGYVLHLAMDEVWSRDLLKPYFGDGTWATRDGRFLMLHVLLIDTDRRDEAACRAHGIPEALAAAYPRAWSPFLSDTTLGEWRDLIARQLLPNGRSETLDVFSPRVSHTPETMTAILADTAGIDAALWANVPRAALTAIETAMYAYALASLIEYLKE